MINIPNTIPNKYISATGTVHQITMVCPYTNNNNNNNNIHHLYQFFATVPSDYTSNDGIVHQYLLLFNE